jgi:hypothetical protein
MNIKLVQLLDCEGEPIGLYTYNDNAYDLKEVTEAIDKAYGDAREVLLSAGEDPNDEPTVGDVEGDAEEALSKIGIYRVCAETHVSEHF